MTHPSPADGAPLRVVVLTEDTLTPADAARLAQVHGDAPVAYHLLVPTDSDRSVLADVLDHLSLFELREALEAVRGEGEATHAEAGDMLAASIGAFADLADRGVTAGGELVDGNPVQALVKVVAERDAAEVVVVTSPHAVEDTFHTDWASKAREQLGVPVLHVYAGSSWLG